MNTRYFGGEGSCRVALGTRGRPLLRNREYRQTVHCFNVLEKNNLKKCLSVNKVAGRATINCVCVLAITDCCCFHPLLFLTDLCDSKPNYLMPVLDLNNFYTFRRSHYRIEIVS